MSDLIEAELVEIRGRSFGQETVEADGFVFVDCTFSDTTLVFRGINNFAFENCSGKKNIEPADAALVVLNQLALLHQTGLHEYVESVFALVRRAFQEGRLN